MSIDTPALTASDLDLRLRDCLRRGNEIQLGAFECIRQLSESGLYFELGYPSLWQYLVDELDMSGSDASRAISAAKRLPDLPRLSLAFRLGQLSWTSLREIVRVATTETEQEWIDYRKERGAKALLREVSCAAREGRDRPRQGRHSLPPQTVRIQFALTADQAECLEEKLRLAREKQGGPGDDGAFLEALLDQYLASDDAEFPARKVETAKTVVYRQCPGCRASAIDTAAGPVEIEPEVVDAAVASADVVRIDPVEESPEPPLSTGERDIPTPPELRRKVLARDGHRCRSCGCTQDLHVHHIHYRRRGGRTHLSNLITTCDQCHALLHDGRLTIEGDPGTEVHLHRGRRQRATG